MKSQLKLKEDDEIKPKAGKSKAGPPKAKSGFAQFLAQKRKMAAEQKKREEDEEREEEKEKRGEEEEEKREEEKKEKVEEVVKESEEQKRLSTAVCKAVKGDVAEMTDDTEEETVAVAVEATKAPEMENALLTMAEDESIPPAPLEGAPINDEGNQSPTGEMMGLVGEVSTANLCLGSDGDMIPMAIASDSDETKTPLDDLSSRNTMEMPIDEPVATEEMTDAANEVNAGDPILTTDENDQVPDVEMECGENEDPETPLPSTDALSNQSEGSPVSVIKPSDEDVEKANGFIATMDNQIGQ